MENITVIKQLNKYNREQYYFSIDRNYLAGLRKYIINDYRAQSISTLLSESDDERIIVNFDFFESVLTAILLKSDFDSDFEFFNSQAGIFLEQYNEAYQKYIGYRGEVKNTDISDLGRQKLTDRLIRNALDGNTLEIQAILSSSKELIDVCKKIYKCRDLFNAREQVLDSLSTIVSPLEIMNYRSQYTKLLNERPLDLAKIEDYLKGLQQLIVKDWQNKVSDLSTYKPGDKFRFICHSTSSEHINGEFYSNLVSCSLLTEEFTDTYRSGYGFIFPPNNIVGADGSDMYVHNYTDDDESMLNSTTVPKITSMGRVLEMCRNTKEENKKEGKKEKVYSEIVVRGFNPIGIFCLTVGDKELNHNYISAKKLQAQYPDLPIIEIDLTYYKDKSALLSSRDNLIYSIERNINPNTFKQDTTYYDNYDYFWERFLELKRKGNYQVTDIIDLYRENSELLSFHLDLDKLLSGKYSVDAIQYAIMHNSQYRLQHILSGKFNAYDLIYFRDSIKDKVGNPLLEQALPGISKLIDILNRLQVSDIDIANYPCTIGSLTDALVLSVNKKVEANQSLLETLLKEKSSLENAYRENETSLSSQQHYYEVISNRLYYSFAENELKNSEEYLESCRSSRKEKQAKYDETRSRYDSYQAEYNEVAKHKLLNRSKLMRLKQEIDSLEITLRMLKDEIELDDVSITSTRENIKDIRRSFKETTGLELDNFDGELMIANERFDSDLQFNLPYTLRSIQMQIDEINERIKVLEQVNENLQRERIR